MNILLAMCLIYQFHYNNLNIQMVYKSVSLVVFLFHRNLYSTNSLWPSDIIWQHRSGSALAQVMASCLTAPSNYLNLNHC